MSFADFGLTESVVSTLILLYSFLAFVLAAVVVFLFFLKGFGIYKISKKLKIDNSWYSFVPILNSIAFGKAADTVNDEKSNYKNLFLIGLALKYVLTAVSVVLFTLFSVKLIFAADLAVLNGTNIDINIFKDATAAVVVFVLAVLAAIFYGVVKMLCAIKIYKAFNVKNAVLKAVIGFVLSFTFPFFVYMAAKDEAKKAEILSADEE